MPSTANALILHLNTVYLDFVGGLRTVNIPMELMRKFIDAASPNTRLNRETCGILAGRLVRLNSLTLFLLQSFVLPRGPVRVISY